MNEEMVTVTRKHYCELATDAGPILGEAQADREFWRDTAQEAAADRDRLREVLDDILNRFTERGHPGRPCLRTGWQSKEQVEAWRSVLQTANDDDVRF